VAFTDRDGQPAEVPEPPDTGSVYDQIGAFQAAQYHRNAFAMGTAQEAAVLAEALDLSPGSLILDVGCGNGRHVAALQDLGYRAVGLDLSEAVLAGGSGMRVAGRAQSLPFASGSVDGVISVCQGGFGITPAQDDLAVGEWSRVLRTGGRAALTAFSLVFASRFMGEGESFDVVRGLHHHLADVRGGEGRRTFDLWTAAYSVPHLQLLLGNHGLEAQGAFGVEPGGYQVARAPSVTDPEVLVVAELR
jgi:SAM-dependent methyltransferase